MDGGMERLVIWMEVGVVEWKVGWMDGGWNGWMER